jgi:hypothetical protein
MSRVRLAAPTLARIRPNESGLPNGMLVPLLFTPEAWGAYLLHTSWVALSARDCRCLLFGRRESHALVVRAIVSDDLPPADRADFLALIRDEHLVLLGQAHDFTEKYVPRVEAPRPYVYLLTHSIDHQTITACHSVAGDRVTNHPVAILYPPTTDDI